MIYPLFLTLAAMAQGPSADVTASRIVRGDRETVAARLRSTTDFAGLLPTSCVSDWTHGADPTGPAEMTYKILSFRRRLTARLTEPDPNHVIELDHEGTKGFVTRVVLTVESPTTTKVELTTYINPPGWPFKSYYADKVHPLWTACYVEALEKLDAP